MDLPDIGGVVAAFGAFDSDGGKRAQLLLFFADYGDELLGVVLDNFAQGLLYLLLRFRFLIAAFGTDKLKRGFFAALGFLWLQSGTAFGTELHLETPYQFCVPPLHGFLLTFS